MANYFLPLSLRELLSKIKAIANINKRYANKEVEFVRENYVSNYEKDHGKIEIKES